MKTITADELLHRMDAGDQFNIVDVREDEEVAQGVIPGAIHIPLGDLEARHSELDSNKHYIMVCRSGGRSTVACEILSEKGYDITNMTGGMLAWNGELQF